MKNNLLFITITILLIGCNPDNFILKTKACFDYSPTDNLKTSDTIKFSNCSLNSNYYYWDFGDGSFSYEKNPKHVFYYKQSYKVKLFIANNPLGDTLNTLESDTISKFINITKDFAKADFLHSMVSVFKVYFSNNSLCSTNFKWDFGDGTTSIEKSPTHTYKSSGTYTVKLIASNESGSDSINKTISVDDIVYLNENYSIGRKINIDIDNDGVNDLRFDSYQQYSTSRVWKYWNITALNGYEINYEKFIINSSLTYFNKDTYKDTTVYSVSTHYCPKVRLFGDVIKNSDDFTASNKTLKIYEESETWGYPIKSDSGIKILQWLGNGEKYIVYRKELDNKTKIGWIKLNLMDDTKLILYSFKIPNETISLVIDK